MQEKLPIHDVIPSILEALNQGNALILQAAPGAGKSTVLPLFFLDSNWLDSKKILMLEPRRLAAKAVAWRLADSLGEEPGMSVGYRVRFETCINRNTRIEVVTEGILTRMLQSDNSLKDYGMVIFDEFHERSLHADLSLALCREIQDVLRPDLRILLMSATFDGEELATALGGVPVISSTGRQHPVSFRYLEPDSSLSIAHNTCRVILRALSEEPGDVLVFLPGSGDIHRTAKMLEEAEINARIHVLYGDLPIKKQQEALLPDPANRRKVILSTSIAETSLTIEGIRIVVDCGYARVPRFDLRSGLTKLDTVRITKDRADQRAGRAGRLGPGICYRLWPERSNHQLLEHREPEILDADLTSLVLELALWGYVDPNQLQWITSPPTAAIVQARSLLESLDALKNNRITEQGKRLLEFPTHPRIAHLLLYGREHGLSALASDVAALLEEKDPLSKEAGADISLRTEMLQGWRKHRQAGADRNSLERIERISKQWRTLLDVKSGCESSNHDEAGRLLAAAYPERIAKKEGASGCYRLANGRTGKLNEHDPLTHEEWIAIAQIDGATREGKIFLAAPFNPAEILTRTISEEVLSWDERKGILIARSEWKVRNLLVSHKPLVNPDPQAIASLMCSVVRKEGLNILDWTEQAEQFLSRVMSLKAWKSDLDIPDLKEENLIRTVELWLGPYLQNIRTREDFKKIKLVEKLHSMLSWEHHRILDKLVPEKILVPSGSTVPLNYFSDGSAPVLAVRLQEIFGWPETPTVNDGKIKIVLHLLSPGYRPVQVTQDLKSFWNTTYTEVRKELRVRYQKHSWPEDPWTAQAVRGTKKKKL